MVEETTRKVFTVYGKDFLTKDEAIKYQLDRERMLKYLFFDIRHAPDLNEGRGYSGYTSIAVLDEYGAEQIALAYCFSKYGSPVKFVQGCSMMPGWIITSEQRFKDLVSLDKYIKEEIIVGLLAKRTTRRVLIITVDNKLNFTEVPYDNSKSNCST